MLSTQILSCYNHLLATTILYLSIVDPLQELASNLDNLYERDQHHLPSLVMASSDDSRDYYEILGVNKDSTKHEIHKAFRQLAKKYHPDKNKEKGAQDEFIKIFKAYETLNDEKKRKEYDERSNGSNHGSFTSWQTNGMHDFDMNDFFKQYEDQLSRHAQDFNHHQHYHQQQHHNHHHNQHNHDRFTFHGVNLDDLFHDIDEDEFQSFGRMFEFDDHHHNQLHNNLDSTFGDGASFFGNLPSHLHDSLNHYQHNQNYQKSSDGNRGSYSCHTVTKQVNGMVMTQTSCV